jgi:hypothetical protein
MSFIQLGRVRITARPQSGDVSFFEDGAPPPVLPALSPREEAESLAVWRKARKRRAKEAQTSRGLVSLGLYAGALIALSHMDRAVESWATPQADGDGGAPPDRPGEVAAAIGAPTPLPISAGLAWTVSQDGVTETPMGTGASIAWPVRAAPGSSTSFSEIVVRAESAAIPVSASAESARVEVSFAGTGAAADGMRAPAPMTFAESAIALPTEARLPGTAKSQQPTEARPAPREAAAAAQPVQAEAQPAPKAAPATETVVASPAPSPAQSTPVSIETAEAKPVWAAPVVTVEVTPVAVMPEQIVVQAEPDVVIQIAQPVPRIEEQRVVETRAEKGAVKAEVPVAKAETPVAADSAVQPVKDTPKDVAGNGKPVEVEVTTPSTSNGRPVEVEVVAPTPATDRPVEVSVGVVLPKLGDIVSDILKPVLGGRGEAKAPEATPVVDAGPAKGGQGAAEEVQAGSGTAVPPGQAAEAPGRSGSAPGRQEAATPVAAEATPAGGAPAETPPAAAASAEAPAVAPVASPASQPAPAANGQAAAPDASPPASPAAPATVAESAAPDTPPGQQAKDAPPATTAEAAPQAAEPGGGKPAQAAEALKAAEPPAAQPAVETAEANGKDAKATPASNRPAEAEVQPAKAEPEPEKGGGNGKGAAKDEEDVAAAIEIAAGPEKGAGHGGGPKHLDSDTGPDPEAIPAAEMHSGTPPITSDLIF